jgi:hypothetical protein
MDIGDQKKIYGPKTLQLQFSYYSILTSFLYINGFLIPFVYHIYTSIYMMYVCVTSHLLLLLHLFAPLDDNFMSYPIMFEPGRSDDVNGAIL